MSRHSLRYNASRAFLAANRSTNVFRAAMKAAARTRAECAVGLAL